MDRFKPQAARLLVAYLYLDFTCSRRAGLAARQPEGVLGGVKVDLDRAVRLRELWNGSFRLNLFILPGLKTGYVLRGTMGETSVESFEILKRLSSHLGLDLEIKFGDFTIN